MSLRPASKKEQEELVWKAKNGLALNLRELAVVLGYSYRTLCQWKVDGLPLVDGKLPSSEAWAWRKKHLAAQEQSPRASSVEHLIPAALR